MGKFCIMKEPYFKPWIGENYESSKPRILILGESHYSSNPDEKPDFTQGIVAYWALGGKGNRFFTTIAKVVSEKPHEWMRPNDKEAFWQSVAFYNFIQEIVGKEARIRPTEQMWQNAQEPLKNVLTNLSPEIVVVLGKALRGYTEPILSSYSEIISCYWTHPSAFGHFNKQESIDAFKQAKSRLVL